MNVTIYLHGPGQFLDLNGRLGHSITPGQSMETQVTYQDVEMLPKIKEDGKPSCANMNYDACMYDSMTESMYEEVSFIPTCLTFFYYST